MRYIYTLSHPITNEVRYVGKTINIKRRYKQHLYDKRGSHKSNWVQSLRKQNLKPVITILEECDNWQEREIYWISQFGNLTNFLAGGGVEYKQPTSDETREKMRQKQLGKTLSKETKQKIGYSVSKKLLGKSKTQKHRNNILKGSTKRKIVIINNIQYDSIRQASRQLNISLHTITLRLNSKEFNNYLLK